MAFTVQVGDMSILGTPVASTPSKITIAGKPVATLPGLIPVPGVIPPPPATFVQSSSKTTIGGIPLIRIVDTTNMGPGLVPPQQTKVTIL